ncbi:hypothetical protein K432DRAFT_381275 [Lepidopterella palustris CBS 459.81]|uniref:F-box domain-containing protein n=1 Tax=Lepidopterella palustris CBS 459.81 TaxID=1314670 RepID=A0A8E2ECN9_9PEZI|nr:hypothetical protein K432DRAFT_381275 [Lepidopterella palustris CBS 459.81]
MDDTTSALMALPIELRLQIFSYLLHNMPSSYGYTGSDQPEPSDSVLTAAASPARQTPLRRHGMLLANAQLSAEYTQAFYERTDFFFYISGSNGLRPPFWKLSPAMLPNVRRCKLYIELAAIESRGALPAGGGSVCRRSFSTRDFLGRVLGMLTEMRRLRELHLVWDISAGPYPPRARLREVQVKRARAAEAKGWDMEFLGMRVVEEMKGRESMRGMVVAVGDEVVRMRREKGVWIEEEEVLPC